MTKSQLANLIILLISQIDKKISSQLDAIMHHKRLQRLEATWRGLYYLAEQLATTHDTHCKLKIISLSWSELNKDLSRAIEFDQSELFNKIHNQEFGHPGGEPFGLLLGDYSFRHCSTNLFTSDIYILERISKIAAAAFAPFISAVHPSLFGLAKFSEVERIIDLKKTFQQYHYRPWDQFRKTEEARFISLLLPRVLMRLPYRHKLAITHPFFYEESIGSTKENFYLWGSPIYSFAASIFHTFNQTGWFSDIVGFKVSFTDLPNTGGKIPVTDAYITDQQERKLSDFGFIALSECKYSGHASFYSCTSLYQFEKYTRTFVTKSDKLTGLISYILCGSRFSHYLKIIARDKVGTLASTDEWERFLQNWLHQYCGANENHDINLRSKYPLRAANIEISEQQGKFNSYLCIIHLQPHMQFKDAGTHLRLVTELRPK